MTKGLITTLGLVAALGVVALGFFLIALPTYLQSVTVDGQTASVASMNALYQAQVEGLREQEENLDEINAEVTDLRMEIPAQGQLDDVFEVIGNAAAASGVALTTISAGEQTPFVVRTTPGDPEPAAPVEPAPDASAAPTEGDGTEGAAVVEPAPSGRVQVDFVIRATAQDTASVTAFLDALRSGPRLLTSVTGAATRTDAGSFDIQVTALTFVGAEG